MHTRRTPCKDEARDGGAASTSQGAPNISGNLPEARREAWDTSFLDSPQKEPTLVAP